MNDYLQVRAYDYLAVTLMLGVFLMVLMVKVIQSG